MILRPLPMFLDIIAVIWNCEIQEGSPMGKISKMAVATALGAVTLGSSASAPAMGDPLTPPRQIVPDTEGKQGSLTSVEGAPLAHSTPMHFAPNYFATPRHRLIALEKSTGVNTSTSFSPMEHSPLLGIPLIPSSVKLSPHGDAHSWSVSPTGVIAFTPGNNFQGRAKASYSVEDASGTIITSAITVSVA